MPPTSGWYVNPALTASTTYGSSPVLPYKWMRITLKTDQAAVGTANIMYVDGKSANAAYYACWNSSTDHEFVQSTACASPNPVYILAALAVTPSGTRRILEIPDHSRFAQFDVARRFDFGWIKLLPFHIGWAEFEPICHAGQ